ncbi:helix-turn-helix domain-containing protein [Microbacterium suaedae]|uniref:helix-turn-helix domain-containing protein n=1 Tax=Microbacterium suaedae TaxID=2067813 RepID=UPI000DA2157B|nr:helix-turn-helix domain-containing protein [Microbacterium suaedae]
MAPSTSPDSPDPRFLVGRRLRDARERVGVSLSELARRLDISASAVSQIERGVMQPSVARLITISDALGISLADVLSDPATPDGEQRVSIERAEDAARLELGGGVTFRRLTPGDSPGVDYFESVYPPGSTAAARDRLLRHEGYEVGHVISGELTIDFSDEIVVLRPDDTITYPCDRPHRLHNAGDVPVVARWLIVHPTG